MAEGKARTATGIGFDPECEARTGKKVKDEAHAIACGHTQT
jgi:hypothetical protein